MRKYKNNSNTERLKKQTLIARLRVQDMGFHSPSFFSLSFRSHSLLNTSSCSAFNVSARSCLLPCFLLSLLWASKKFFTVCDTSLSIAPPFNYKSLKQSPKIRRGGWLPLQTAPSRHDHALCHPIQIRQKDHPTNLHDHTLRISRTVHTTKFYP